MAKVLVIDDEQGIRSLLDTLLRRKGYDVVLAESGRKGLELFRRERPDVIVLDLKMPEMDGLTVLQQVRALGVTEYVEKEFSLHLLGDSLKRLLKTPDPVT
jgi:CheY-like chemotaxis protein